VTGALASDGLVARGSRVLVRHGLLGAYVVGLGVSITLSQLALTALTLVWLWRLTTGAAARRRVSLPLLGPVLAFSGASLLSALTSNDPVASVMSSKGLLLVMALYVTVDALSDGTEPDRFLDALVLVGAFAALVGIVQVMTCSVPPESGLATRLYRCARARGFFSIYMTQAGVLTVLLLASAPRLLPGAAGRARAAAPWLVMVLGLAATYVRGAWLGLGAGMLALIAVARRGRWLVLAALAALVVLALSGPEQLRQRVRSMTDPQEATIKERLYMWRSGAAMLQERPLLGMGPGGVRREYPRFALPEAVKKRTGHVHNTPLQILIERGLVGFAAWLWIWVAFYLRVGALLRGLGPDRPGARALAAGSLAAVTGFLVAGISEYNFGDAEVILVAWTVMALPFAAARRGEAAGAGPG